MTKHYGNKLTGKQINNLLNYFWCVIFPPLSHQFVCCFAGWHAIKKLTERDESVARD